MGHSSSVKVCGISSKQWTACVGGIISLYRYPPKFAVRQTILAEKWIAIPCYPARRAFLYGKSVSMYNVVRVSGISCCRLVYETRTTLYKSHLYKNRISNATSKRVLRMKSSGYPLSRRLDLKFYIILFSSNSVLEELVLRSLRASPLMNPLLTPHWRHEEKRVYWF